MTEGTLFILLDGIPCPLSGLAGTRHGVGKTGGGVFVPEGANFSTAIRTWGAAETKAAWERDDREKQLAAWRAEFARREAEREAQRRQGFRERRDAA